MNVVLRNSNGFAVPAGFRSTRYDSSVEQLVDRLFGEAFSGSSKTSESVATAPRINVVESDTAYEVQAELPGVVKEDLKVSVDGKRVSLEAEVKRDTERKEGEKVILVERSVLKFARAFSLSKDIDDERVIAKLENGILTLTLPKKEEARPKQITIQ